MDQQGYSLAVVSSVPVWKPAQSIIPTDPGVYKFIDEHGRVIYVGKAKNLRQRLSSYFIDPSQLHPKTRQMVGIARDVQWTVVSTEVEALQLEYTWIKQFDPRYNIRFKDDKTYPLLAVTLAEEFPRFGLYRGEVRPKVRYFGPFSHAWAIRDTLDIIAKVFQVRTCTQGVFKRHKDINRPCLLGYIDKCSAPCVGKITPEHYRNQVNSACSFLAGKTEKITAQISAHMKQAAQELDFESAARLRDNLYALERALERQTVVLTDQSDADIIGLAHDDLEVAIEIFHVRQGRVRGQHGWIVQRNLSPISHDDSVESRGVKSKSDNDVEILRECLLQFYSTRIDHEKTMNTVSCPPAMDNIDPATNWIQSELSPIPHEILVPFLPSDAEELMGWLSMHKHSKAQLRVPVRGDKKILLDTVQKNAQTSLERNRLRRIGDVNARSAALTELMNELNLPSAPLRIECVDISHLQGTDVVASLVVFEDGLPKKNDYRHYNINNAAGDGYSNDVASIAEITMRRFTRYLQEQDLQGQTAQVSSFSYPPNVYIVDGGAPQVNSAYQVLQGLGLEEITVIGIAKRLEEIWLPYEEFPIIFPRNSSALFLLQHIRDEAHRFAIRYHRSKRSKRLTESRLDTIGGIGAQRKAHLVREFGSVANLIAASENEIAQVSGIGKKMAHRIYLSLHSDHSSGEKCF